MPNELCVAGAGSGKTQKIIDESIAHVEAGDKVLVVTYTTNNQAELRSRFLQMYGKNSEKFIVKGLYSFYLEDMIRPYQRIIFPNRIEGIYFNTDNPHWDGKKKRTITGRAEQLENGDYNPLHYLTKCQAKAHSGFLAKLANQIAKLTKNATSKRLKEIYSKVYFDEVQDLVGWDYYVLKYLSAEIPNSICCVGDFRQTIYDTTFGHKTPKTSSEKLTFLFDKLKFTPNPLLMNRRCIQSICDMADAVHGGLYDVTTSNVEIVPDDYAHHLGVFVVKQSDVSDYINRFSPTVLRSSVLSGNKYLPPGAICYNFGASKGLGFDRVLIIPSGSQMKFLLGDLGAFDKDKTEASRNKLYVAITRARYSLGFVIEDKKAEGLGYPLWERT